MSPKKPAEEGPDITALSDQIDELQKKATALKKIPAFDKTDAQRAELDQINKKIAELAFQKEKAEGNIREGEIDEEEGGGLEEEIEDLETEISGLEDDLEEAKTPEKKAKVQAKIDAKKKKLKSLEAKLGK
jgi:predicted  nucleic acid-binding Zn-ribbon protein